MKYFFQTLGICFCLSRSLLDASLGEPAPLWLYNPTFLVAHFANGKDHRIPSVTSLPFSFNGVDVVDFAKYAHESALADMEIEGSVAPVGLYNLYDDTSLQIADAALFGDEDGLLRLNKYQGESSSTTLSGHRIYLSKGEACEPVIFGSDVVTFHKPSSSLQIRCTRRDPSIPYMGFQGSIDWENPLWPFGEDDFSTVNAVVAVYR